MNIPELVKLIDSIQLDIKYYQKHLKDKAFSDLLQKAKLSLASASVNLEAYYQAKEENNENNKHKR